MVDTKHDSKPDREPDPNVVIYNSSEVTEYYAALDYLTPCERLLFDEYLQRGWRSSTSVWAEAERLLTSHRLRDVTLELITPRK